ncbi:hypothetical protein C8P63_1465 [Melghirimyces profundicolus]|uniref:Uncharacterized protein n=1 Tax=Melghirimyces profundicolus TaxID=1242148 RepID=A0A2T6AWX5_9BACL|nr:hypothetical protein C8P63_1465 [Melghirimyces profundicolus]
MNKGAGFYLCCGLMGNVSKRMGKDKKTLVNKGIKTLLHRFCINFPGKHKKAEATEKPPSSLC